MESVSIASTLTRCRMILNKTFTHTDPAPQACLSLSIDQPDLSNSTPSPPGPGSPEEGPSQPRYVEGPATLRAPTPACLARLISLSLCQGGERERCQRTQTTQQRGLRLQADGSELQGV